MSTNILQTGIVGPYANGTQSQQRGGRQGDATVSELHGRYYEQTYAKQLFSMSLATPAAVTAYTGGAAGTPMMAIYNPLGSGVNVIPLILGISQGAAASAAGVCQFSLFFGPSTTAITATPNGTIIQNLANGAKGSSASLGFTNTALTGAIALTSALPLACYYWATEAGAVIVTPGPLDIAGSIIIPPGSYMALGGSNALTSATWGGYISWEENPT